MESGAGARLPKLQITVSNSPFSDCRKRSPIIELVNSGFETEKLINSLCSVELNRRNIDLDLVLVREAHSERPSTIEKCGTKSGPV
jgi:hypothetical protein